MFTKAKPICDTFNVLRERFLSTDSNRKKNICDGFCI